MNCLRYFSFPKQCLNYMTRGPGFYGVIGLSTFIPAAYYYSGNNSAYKNDMTNTAIGGTSMPQAYTPMGILKAVPAAAAWPVFWTKLVVDFYHGGGEFKHAIKIDLH